MQYILGQDEYNELVERKHRDLAKERQRIANLMGLFENSCILNKSREYCDNCPAKDLCTYEFKEFEK